MNSTKKTARIAGLLHLVNGATGFFGSQRLERTRQC